MGYTGKTCGDLVDNCAGQWYENGGTASMSCTASPVRAQQATLGTRAAQNWIRVPAVLVRMAEHVLTSYGDG